jgi:hypothetical protein
LEVRLLAAGKRSARFSSRAVPNGLIGSEAFDLRDERHDGNNSDENAAQSCRGFAFDGLKIGSRILQESAMR